MALIVPSRGGMLAELDVRRIQHNLLATLSRQPEAYHRKVLAGANQQNGNCASIHDRVVFKQADLDQRIQYDKYPRKSLLDLFYDNETTLAAVASGQADVRSDFTQANYEAKIRRNANRIQVQLVRDGWACGVPVRITKGLTLDAGSATLEIAYLLENLPQDRPLHFAVEMNFAGLPSGRRRPLLPRPRRQPPGAAWHAARSGRVPGPAPVRRVAGHRRGAEDLAADAFLDLPGRDGQPERGRFRAGASIDRRAAALVRDRRSRGPLVGDHAVGVWTPAGPRAASPSGSPRRW